MRCPDCNKFVAYEEGEPEVEVDYDQGTLVGTVRIVLNCAGCGTELKETTFDVNDEVELPEGVEEAPETAEVTADAELIARVEHTKTKTLKNGTVKTVQIPPRYQKTFYGYELTYEVIFPSGQTVNGKVGDEVPASAMDELV